MPSTSLAGAAPVGSQAGGRRGVSVKTLKRMLKKAGLKTSGRKAALTRRAKKAHLKLRGGVNGPVDKDGDVIMAQEQKDVKMSGGGEHGSCTTSSGGPGYTNNCWVPPQRMAGGRRRRTARGGGVSCRTSWGGVGVTDSCTPLPLPTGRLGGKHRSRKH